MSKVVNLLKGLGYQNVPSVTRSPFWKKQFQDSSVETWLYNQGTATGDHYEQVVLLQVPNDAVGHDGFAHGGFLAALLDESLCFCAYPVLPHRTGMTVALNIDYKAPTPAGEPLIIRAIAESKPESRKATVTAEIYPIKTLDLTELPWATGSEPSVTATQIVVEPKWYDKLTHK